MAVENPELIQPIWAHPVWPDRLPDAETMRILYGADADELVIRFDNARYRDVTVVLITTPTDDYAGLLVEGDRGAIIGVHVYPLVAFAVQRHPAWRAATEPNPTPEVATRIVNDVKHLFERYGIENPDPE